jgi:hypothetical protein
MLLMRKTGYYPFEIPQRSQVPDLIDAFDGNALSQSERMLRGQSASLDGDLDEGTLMTRSGAAE